MASDEQRNAETHSWCKVDSTDAFYDLTASRSHTTLSDEGRSISTRSDAIADEQLGVSEQKDRTPSPSRVADYGAVHYHSQPSQSGSLHDWDQHDSTSTTIETVHGVMVASLGPEPVKLASFGGAGERSSCSGALHSVPFGSPTAASYHARPVQLGSRRQYRQDLACARAGSESRVPFSCQRENTPPLRTHGHRSSDVHPDLHTAGRSTDPCPNCFQGGMRTSGGSLPCDAVSPTSAPTACDRCGFRPSSFTASLPSAPMIHTTFDRGADISADINSAGSTFSGTLNSQSLHVPRLSGGGFSSGFGSSTDSDTDLSSTVFGGITRSSSMHSSSSSQVSTDSSSAIGPRSAGSSPRNARPRSVTPAKRGPDASLQIKPNIALLEEAETPWSFDTAGGFGGGGFSSLGHNSKEQDSD